MIPLGQTWRITTAVIRRPDLWSTALRTALRLHPQGGLLPPTEYLEHRGSAVYGEPLGQVPAREFVRYLEWCKAFPGPIR